MFNLTLHENPIPLTVFMLRHPLIDGNILKLFLFSICNDVIDKIGKGSTDWVRGYTNNVKFFSPMLKNLRD